MEEKQVLWGGAAHLNPMDTVPWRECLISDKRSGHLEEKVAL